WQGLGRGSLGLRPGVPDRGRIGVTGRRPNFLANSPIGPYLKFSVGRRFMPTYRLHKLDVSGKFAASEELEASDDDAALNAFRALRHPFVCELWLARRLIARVGAA